MSEIIKQGMADIWASSGDIVAPDAGKVAEGWLVEVVPRQYWNWMQNRTDVNLAYVLQHGIPEWDAITEFIANKSYVQHAGIVYKAILTGINQNPATATTYWEVAFATSTAALEALKATTPATDKLPYFSSSSTATTTTLTSLARSLLDDTSQAAMLTTIGAQPADATLTALAGVTTATNKLPYFSGSDTAAVTDLTAFGRSLIDDAGAAAARTTLELVKQTSQTDATVGSVLTVGAFGWGATSSTPGNTADCNAVNIPGNYLMPVTSPVNAPSGASTRGKLVHMGVVADYATQMFFDQGASNRVWLRTGNNSTWRAWVEIWTSDNLVKTTSATDTTSGRVWRTDDLVKTTGATDTTAGRMLKVGDFGVGGAIGTTDFNTLVYGWSYGLATATNAPAGASGVFMCMTMGNLTGTGSVTQLGQDSGNSKLWSRTFGGSVWTVWVEVTTSASSLGHGQTWQDVTGTRALQTTYTNTTNKPIHVSVTTFNTTGAGSVSLNVNGVTSGFSQTPTVGSYTTMSAVVPIGGQYLATNVGTQSTLYAWTELR